MRSLNVGQVISNEHFELRIEKLLGTGSSAVVWQAQDLRLPRKVAVKVISAQSNASAAQLFANFKDEAQTMAKLKHPNILQVYNFAVDEAAQEAYLVMELAGDGTLHELLLSQPNSYFSLDPAANYFRQLVAGVKYAHQQWNIIHRDLKPQNLLLNKNAYIGQENLLIADFGIAKILSNTNAFTNTRSIGSPYYMAKEVWFDKAGKPSDIYAMGIILYEMLAGQPPFVGSPGFVQMQHCSNEYPLPNLLEIQRDLPKNLQPFLENLTAKEQSNRPTIGEIEALFEEALQERFTLATTNFPSSPSQTKQSNIPFGTTPQPKKATATMDSAYTVEDFAFPPEKSQFPISTLEEAKPTNSAKERKLKKQSREPRRYRKLRKRILLLDIIAVIALSGLLLAKPKPAAITQQYQSPVSPMADITSFLQDASVAWSPDGTRLAYNHPYYEAYIEQVNSPVNPNFPSSVKGVVGNVQGIWGPGLRKLVWSPDGLKIATSDPRGFVWIDAFNGYVASEPSIRVASINDMSWSPDSNTLATAASDGTVQLWAVNVKFPVTFTGHSGSVYTVVWSPDGTKLASAGADDTIRIWSVKGILLTTLKGHTDEIHTISWSPDGHTLISGGYDHTLRMWSMDNYQLIKIIYDHSAPVEDVAWSPDGSEFASASRDDTLRLWDSNGNSIAVLRGAGGWVENIKWRKDSKLIAASSEDGTIRVWQKDGQLVKTITDKPSSSMDLSWSPDGNELFYIERGDSAPQESTVDNTSGNQ